MKNIYIGKYYRNIIKDYRPLINTKFALYISANNIYSRYLIYLITWNLSPSLYQSLLIWFNSQNLITCGCCDVTIINIKHYYDYFIEWYNDVLVYNLNTEKRLAIFDTDMIDFICEGFPVMSIDWLIKERMESDNLKTLVLAQHKLKSLIDIYLPSKWIAKEILYTNIKHTDTVYLDLDSGIFNLLDILESYSTLCTPIFTITLALCRVYIKLRYIG